MKASDVHLFSALSDTSFTELISLKLIKWLYILFLMVVGLGVLWSVWGGFGDGLMNGIGNLMVTALFALGAVILGRVYLELVAVAFRIASYTAEIADHAAEIAINTSDRSRPARVRETV